MPGVQSGDASFVDAAFFNRFDGYAAAGAVHGELEYVGWVAADAGQVRDNDRVITAVGKMARQPP